MAIVQELTTAEGSSHRRLGLSSPVTLESIGEIEVANAADVRAAVSRAREAQRKWALLGFKERGSYLKRALSILLEKQDDYLEVILRETGKPRVEAVFTEIFASCDFLSYWAKHSGRILKERKRRMHLLGPLKKLRIIYKPLGVVGVVTPWNAPFVLSLNATAQALMAGNAVLLKPSEVTPYGGKLVGDLFEEAGLPEGLLQVLLGDGETGAALIEEGIDKMAFTGSVATGRRVAEACASRLIPCTLELGGKDPLIVCADADLDRAVGGALFGAMMNAGQVCMSAERIYVVEEVADEFIEKIVETARGLRQSDTGESDIGPIIQSRQLAIIERHVEDARAKGADILLGGRRNPDLKGLYFEPTVMTGLSDDMLIMSEETFGPIVAIVRVKDEEEALERANRSDYGLSSSVWTRDEAKGMALARRINSGSVCINDWAVTYGAAEAPFGGVKNSGLGQTNGDAGLLGFCHAQPILSDRFGRKDEMVWYPYTAETEKRLQRAMKFLWGSRLGRMFF